MKPYHPTMPADGTAQPDQSAQDDDASLLRLYAHDRSDPAFAELLRRHLPWVRAAARRQVRDPSLADDVAQAVFIALAQQASTLRPDRPLAAWLFTVTRYAAANAARAAARRARHEQKAAAMNPSATPPSDRPSEWDAVAPLLDASVARLRKSDRAAVLLRFYQQKTFPEVAAALGISEAAARKRTTRAVARLRELFAARGLSVAPAVLVPLLETHAAHPTAAPFVTSTLQSVAASAMSATPTLPATLAHSAVRAITVAKTKAVATVAAATLLIAGIGITPFLLPASAPAPSRATSSRTPDSPQSALAELSAEYTLVEGEALRLFFPPFSPARAAFADAQYPYARGSDNIRSLGFNLDDRGRLQNTYMSYVDQSLDSILTLGLHIPWYNVAGLDKVKFPPAHADILTRADAPIDQKLIGVASLLSRHVGRPVRFTKSTVNRPCIVLTGPTRPGLRNRERFDVLILSQTPLDPATAKRWADGDHPANITHRFSMDSEASRLLDAPFFLTPDPKSDRRHYGNDLHQSVSLYRIAPDAQNLHHTDPDYRPKLRKILDYAQSQIGGTWTIEDRPIDTYTLELP